MPVRQIPDIPRYTGNDKNLSSIFDKLREAVNHLVNADFITEKDIYCKDIYLSENSIYMGDIRLRMDKRTQVLYVCYQGKEIPIIGTENVIPFTPTGAYDPVTLSYMETYVAAEVLEHSTPTYLRISATGQSPGDLHLSDVTNWNKDEALITDVTVLTASTDWDLWILQNDNGYSADDANIPAEPLMIGCSGNARITANKSYQDEDASQEVHLYLVDNEGGNTFDIHIRGFELKIAS